MFDEPGLKLRYIARAVFWTGSAVSLINGIFLGPWYLWLTVGVSVSYILALLLAAFSELLEHAVSADRSLKRLSEMLPPAGNGQQDREALARLKERGALTEEEAELLAAALDHCETEEALTDGTD